MTASPQNTDAIHQGANSIVSHTNPYCRDEIGCKDPKIICGVSVQQDNTQFQEELPEKGRNEKSSLNNTLSWNKKNGGMEKANAAQPCERIFPWMKESRQNQKKRSVISNTSGEL